MKLIRPAQQHADEKISLQMTPMIDIVFQLLVFFIMTFRIVSQEGDFNIKMPRADVAVGLPQDEELPPLVIKLGYTDGQVSISRNGEPFVSFEDLNNFVISYVGTETGPGSARETAEVELDCDYDLPYEYVIHAVTAVSGYVTPEGRVVTLIDKIKFTPPETE